MDVITYYPYRSGFVRGDFLITFPRELMKNIEKELCEKANVSPCNHVCFDIIDDHFRRRSVMFTDFKCIVGERVDRGNW